MGLLIMNKKVFIQKLLFFKTIIPDVLYRISNKTKDIDADLSRYLEDIPYKKVGKEALNYCLLFEKPFRNIFYYRTKEYHVLRAICRLFLKPVMTIEIIGGEIHGGLRIDHNYCVIRPDKAGSNLTIRNGVTIGKGKDLYARGQIQPILGNNVDIYANAVIFGGIKIGNNVKIGAGAVVNKDIPDNCTVIGNPLRIITYKDKGNIGV